MSQKTGAVCVLAAITDLFFDSQVIAEHQMTLKTKVNSKFITRAANGTPNGFLVPIYNIHDGFFPPGKEPQQVYLTVIAPRQVKGPHLHFIRTGCFTCIRGNTRFILKTAVGYEIVLSGEAHEYRTVVVPTGVPAAMQNLGDDEAFVLNMPTPAWTPDMNDEHGADFGDFDFTAPPWPTH